MSLDIRKYLHVAARAFQVTDDELVLMDDWGVREWAIPGIAARLDALQQREAADTQGQEGAVPSGGAGR